jgi:mannose-6-phosphate isomerase-like protein (cupin superfamily)
VVLEGVATFTVNGSALVVRGGSVVVMPPGCANKFVNPGREQLRQRDLHPRDHFETAWLE